MKKSPLPLQSLSAKDGGGKSVSEKESLVKLLRWHFGHSHFRPLQLEAIQAVLSGRDCFCLMPTGGGKSLCYHIPALAKTGIVLVVSPLIALMENQVMFLKEKGIAAEFLSSTLNESIRKKIHEDLNSGKPSTKLLYVTPELIAIPGFIFKLEKLHSRGLLSLIAIDEAHCISTWGHDFRPSYRRLSSLRNHLPNVPILALTATAVPKVQNDVINSLSLHDPLVLKSSFNRSNIYYEVRYKDLLKDTFSDLASTISTSGDSCAIIYCLERSSCDSLSSYLRQQGISSAAYHAGLSDKLRSSVLNDWLSSKTRVVVATVAFGMGIDRKDVRLVCHFNLPKSMEAFYQESGRAGRDQRPCSSIVYYGIDDRKKMEFILKKGEAKVKSSESLDKSSKKALNDLNKIVEYCESSSCRRKMILQSFGEEVSSSFCQKSCDACKHPTLVYQRLEELAKAHTFSKRSHFSHIISSSNKSNEPSEYWNYENDDHLSEEDISQSDESGDDVDQSSSRKLGLHKRLELLEQAEHNYNQRTEKKHSVAATPSLRDTSKQRLSTALAQRLASSEGVDVATSAAALEAECFKEYGKNKTVYHSRVLRTIKWISSASGAELMAKICPTREAVAGDSFEAVGGSLESPSFSQFVNNKGDPAVKRHKTTP